MGVRRTIKEKIKAITKEVPETIIYRGKKYAHHSGAGFSKSYRNFLMRDFHGQGYKTHVTFTKSRGYQIYIRK